MSQSFDDMPEIELDDIVGQPVPSNSPPAVDDQAIELDLSARPIPVPEAPVPRVDDDAIDLGLELPAVQREVEPESRRGVSAGPTRESADKSPVGDPFTPTEDAVSPESSSGVDVDALLADIDDGLTAMSHGPENSKADPSRIAARNDALPEIDNDPLSALNVDLDVAARSGRPTVELQPAEVTVEPEADVHEVELDASVDVEVDPDIDGPELEVDSLAMDAEIEADVVSDFDGEAEVEAEVELESSPTIETAPVASNGFVPQPLLDVLSDEATLPGGYARAAPDADPVPESSLPSVFSAAPVVDNAEAASLSPEPEPESDARSNTDISAAVELDDEISPPFEFRAEHAPIGDHSPVDSQSSPLLIAPADDPDAPPLPLSTHEPVGQPKVPLEQLRPDPKMIESLKRLAGPAAEPEIARRHLIAALRGEDYDPRALPEPQHIALGLARYLVETGHDPDRMADAIIAMMMA
ncbi:MAG: hypothetical protein AAF735_00385 [Myxococcota bacterium]